ncbi:MAG: hypothetical protein JXQ96_19170 [Cyclobacteriaceae bacterium]
MKFIFSIILIYICHLAWSQETVPGVEQPVQTTDEEAEKGKNKKGEKEDKKSDKEKREADFKPSAVNVGIEGLGIARSLSSPGFYQFEGQADIDFDRYFFVLDLGRESNSISNDNFNYSNSGNYFRTGIQVNMMPYNPNRNFFFLGFRYARSSFRDDISYIDSFEKWGDKTLNFENKGVSARWFELNMGMKVKVFERLYFGYTIRYKMAKKMTGYGELNPRNIPGFGRGDKSSVAGFNYYFLYHIPFRDKPVPPKPKREYRQRSSDSEGMGFGDSIGRPF